MQRRRQAWSSGRALAARLVQEYRREYGLAEAPPPAIVVDELITDFLNAELHYDPLPLKIYAVTNWNGKNLVVTVNSLSAKIPGVKNPGGVDNVGKCHELIHLVDHASLLLTPNSGTLPGFEATPEFRCYRARRQFLTDYDQQREIWAEEAGRAFAVYPPALQNCEFFEDLIRLGQRLSVGESWRLLYRAADEIGVNPTALVKQLSLEGLVVVEQERGKQRLWVQPALEGWR